MDWYIVIKMINGRRYRYRQKTWREGKRVRTRSQYIGPVQQDVLVARMPFAALAQFRGTAWRADTGLTLRGSAALELGNIEDFKHLTGTMRSALSKLSAGDVIWVAKSRSVADRAAEAVELGEHPVVLAHDNDGGFLILKDSDKEPLVSERR